MLGVGPLEWLVIGVVALIFIGPKELPAVMKRVGQFAGTIRRMGSEFQRELNKTTGLNEIANLRNSVTAPLKATADAIRKEFNTTTPTGEVKPSGVLVPSDPKVESVVDEIKAAAGMAPSPAPAMTPLTGPANPVAPAVAIAAVGSVKPPEAASAVESPAPPEAKPRVRAARATKVAPPAAAPVPVADIPPARKARARKPIESPAPVEAIAPTPKARPRKAAVAVATPAVGGEVAPAKKPVARKPAAGKSSADEAP